MSDDTKIYHKFKSDDISQFIDNDLYLSTRTIYMGSSYTDYDGGESGVDHMMAERIIKLLHILEAKAPKGDKPITIIMNNPGGEVYHGLAIYDAIQNCKNQVKIHVYGHAMSMGSIILQAADERYMSANAKIMIHYGTDGFYGHSKIMGKWANESESVNAWMEDLFLDIMKDKTLTKKEYYKAINDIRTLDKLSAADKRKKVKIGYRELREMLNYDTIFNAKTSLHLGLVDGILNDDMEYEDYEEES